MKRSPHEPTGRANARPMTGSTTSGSRPPRYPLLIRADVALKGMVPLAQGGVQPIAYDLVEA